MDDVDRGESGDTACRERAERTAVTCDVGNQQRMTWHKVLNVGFVTCEKLAVLALHEPKVTIAFMTQLHTSIREIGDFDHRPDGKRLRTYFAFDGIEARVALFFALAQLLPMSIAEIAGDDVKGGGMWCTFISGKPQKTFKGGCPDTNPCSAFDVKRKVFAISR